MGFVGKQDTEQLILLLQAKEDSLVRGAAGLALQRLAGNGTANLSNLLSAGLASGIRPQDVSSCVCVYERA